ncbi:MAG TPA: sulfatase, partial [Urbifossiella sp.]|nr:sulfatase [Urbifossiella sp.]
AALAKRKAIFGEIFLHTAADLDRLAPNLRYRWVIDGHWKLIVPDARTEPGKAPELYDLYSDPHETKNLAAQHPDTVADLTAKLDAWWKP